LKKDSQSVKKAMPLSKLEEPPADAKKLYGKTASQKGGIWEKTEVRFFCSCDRIRKKATNTVKRGRVQSVNKRR